MTSKNPKTEADTSPTSSLKEKLFETRSILLSEAVTAKTTERMVKELLVLDQASRDPIRLYINSPGGEVNSGFAIYDTIRWIESPVYMINMGLCASIATIINVAVPKERRFSTPNTKFLIHQPWIAGQVVRPASDLEITANEVIKNQARINKILAEACGQDLERVSQDTGRDYWLTAPEAVEYGLVNKIITSVKDLTL